MTKDTILAQVAAAKAAAAIGNCDRASAALQLAWMDLGAFSQQLAATHRSQSAAKKMHSKIVQTYTAVQRRCGLKEPTYRGRAVAPDLLQPTYSGRATSPDLLAPSFNGPLVEGDPGNKPMVGLVLAVLTVGVGFWATR